MTNMKMLDAAGTDEKCSNEKIVTTYISLLINIAKHSPMVGVAHMGSLIAFEPISLAPWGGFRESESQCVFLFFVSLPGGGPRVCKVAFLVAARAGGPQVLQKQIVIKFWFSIVIFSNANNL